MYEITPEINKEPKIFRMLYYKDIIYIILIMVLANWVSGLVAESIVIKLIYFLITLLFAIYLVTPSRDNPQKRHFHSIYYAFKRDLSAYYSLTMSGDEETEMQIGGKENKKKPPKITKKITELLPFTNVLENGLIKTDDGVMDIIRIRGHNIKAAFDYEQEQYIGLFAYFLRVYKPDFKLVVMNFPTKTTQQQQYISQKISQTDNPLYTSVLAEELDRLKFIENNRQDLEFYLFIYAKNAKEYNDNLSTLSRLLKDLVAEPLSIQKKISILRKLNNLNSKVRK